MSRRLNSIGKRSRVKNYRGDTVDCFLISKFRLAQDSKRNIQHTNGLELLYKGLRDFYFEAEPEDFLIAKTDSGKPFFFDKPEYNFNISHSGEHCAVMISDKMCGADIEEIRAFPKKVLKKICTEKETEYIFSLPEDKQEKAMWTLWTLKESYVKAIGKGLSFGMKNVFFDKFPFENNTEKKKISWGDTAFFDKDNMTCIENKFGTFYLYSDDEVCVSFCRSSGT